MYITDDIKYIGVNDREIDLFEGQYVVENGMAYNSYIIDDEKIAVFDTVDARFGNEWLANIKAVLGERKPDYLIVQHMEPDHSANISLFAENYPDAKIVASKKNLILAVIGNNYLGPMHHRCSNKGELMTAERKSVTFADNKLSVRIVIAVELKHHGKCFF